jgi:hypothetical protein
MFCFLEHIDEDVDLVITEIAINDQWHSESAKSYEWLVRGILELPNRPALINVQVSWFLPPSLVKLDIDARQTTALMFDTITMGGDLHTGVATYYGKCLFQLIIEHLNAHHIFTR